MDTRRWMEGNYGGIEYSYLSLTPFALYLVPHSQGYFLFICLENSLLWMDKGKRIEEYSIGTPSKILARKDALDVAKSLFQEVYSAL